MLKIFGTKILGLSEGMTHSLSHRPRCGASGDERNLNLVAQGVGQVETSETLT
jgi:hypothetical protein